MKGWAGYILVALGVVGYNAMTSADRDDAGNIVGAGNVDAFQMRVGDCFNDDLGDEGGEVASIPAVPCGDAHDNEVYAIVDVSADEFPGEDGMAEMAYYSCLDQFDGFVGKAYDESTLEILTLHPSKQSWAQSDREVVCAVYDMNSQKLTGSAKGRAL